MTDKYVCDIESNDAGKQVSADCLFSLASNNLVERNNIILHLERDSPNFLTIGVVDNNVNFIQYGKTPFISKNINLEKSKLSMFVYCVVTIESKDKYIFQSNNKQVNFYVDGVSIQFTGELENDYIILTPGDYFVCIQFSDVDATAFNNSFDVFIKKKGGESLNITKYIEKPVNFLTKIQESKTLADSKYCGPDNYLNSDYCKDIINKETSLNNSIVSKCFSNGLYSSYKGSECTGLLFSESINDELKEIINTEISKWFSDRINNLNSITSLDLERLNILFYKLKKINKLGDILTVDAQKNIVSYCEHELGDKPSFKNETTLCEKIYNIDSDMNLDEVRKSKGNVLLKYCKQLENGVKRYEMVNGETTSEDIKECSPLLKSTALKEEVLGRCIKNNKWSWEDNYCNSLVERNINKEPSNISINKEIFDELLISKNNYSVGETSSIGENNHLLHTEKYITGGLYDYIRNNNSDKEANLENLLINDNFLNYCLEKDSYLSKSSCGNIYDKYADNSKIIRSRSYMRTKNCLSDDNLMTELDTELSKKQNMNNCKSLTTKPDLDSVGIFGVKVAEYCSKDNNIISKDCKDYYNGVTNSLVNSMSTRVSKEENVESMDNRGLDNVNDSIIYSILFIIISICAVLCVYRLINNNGRVNTSSTIGRTALESIGLK